MRERLKARHAELCRAVEEERLPGAWARLEEIQVQILALQDEAARIETALEARGDVSAEAWIRLLMEERGVDHDEARRILVACFTPEKESDRA